MNIDRGNAAEDACDDALREWYVEIDANCYANCFAHGFNAGAAWYAAGMAVCSFLADLAHVYNEERCRHGRPRWKPGVNVRDACEDCWNELPF